MIYFIIQEKIKKYINNKILDEKNKEIAWYGIVEQQEKNIFLWKDIFFIESYFNSENEFFFNKNLNKELEINLYGHFHPIGSVSPSINDLKYEIKNKYNNNYVFFIIINKNFNFYLKIYDNINKKIILQDDIKVIYE